jgi:Xaa-Pro dipeptidase
MASNPFSDHLAIVANNWEAALAFAGFDAAIVAAGESRNHFLDDQAPPLKLNPHFLHWCPDQRAEGSALLIRPGERTRLYFLRPDDYWHLPPELPEWAEAFDVRVYADRDSLLTEVERDALAAGNHIAMIGDSGTDVMHGFQPEDVNPTPLLDHLHFARAVKTAFELDAMREATNIAVRGHIAARRAFEDGASEFGINSAYLLASEQHSVDLPYSNIVALNEHAGILHYQHYDRQPPAERFSFLIDAGGSRHGYASDITRTYAADPNGLFAELVTRLDTEQQALIASLNAGTPYLDLHVDMHRRLAGILCDAGLAHGDADGLFESGLTEIFLPHGLGHLIGLQTHDVGGQQKGPEGGTVAPPDSYPMLRLTRTMEQDMPVTIEPGLYFIPQLLEAARAGDTADLIDWKRVEDLLPCGGIRIEDNVVIGPNGVENLTRNAFTALEGTA